MRRLLIAMLIALLTGSVLFVNRPEPESHRAIFAIRAAPVPLDAERSGQNTVGELTYLGGWALSSDDPSFGGISALVLVGDGFLAVSDAGGLFRFALDNQGRIARAEIGALADGPAPQNGGPVRKRDRDAESMAIDRAAGRFWIGFESANAVWQYDFASGRPIAHFAPDVMAHWPDNGGAEAMVRLADGRFLIFSEEGRGPDGSREALLFDGDPTTSGNPPLRFGYRPPAGFAITDAAELPDGRLAVLNRRFTVTEGVSVIVTIAELAGISEGAVIEGREIARLAPPLTVDNMEALAIGRENGRTILWIASDDNFSPLQRTLLLKFALSPG